MVDFIVAALLCLGIYAPAPSASGDLRVMVILGTPCLPAAYAQISLPHLDRGVLADSLGRATFPRVPAGDFRIVVTHHGSTMLSGTVHLEAGARHAVLADLGARELRVLPTSPLHDR